MKKFTLLILLIYGYLYPLKWDMGFNFEYGVFSIHDESYNLLRFLPKLEIENFSFCYSLNFTYETNGNFIRNQWNNWQMILSRLEYLEYSDNFIFLEIKSKENFTIEDSILLESISTRKFFPFFYYPMGIACLKFDFSSLEFFTDNIVDFDIVGGKIIFKPLYFFNASIWRETYLSLNSIVDFDPYNLLTYNSNTKEYTFEDSPSNISVILYEFQADIPIVKYNFFVISFNTSYTGIYSKGGGLFFGVNGLLFNFLKYGFDYGFCSEKFLPNYINIFYDMERRYKFDMLDTISNGYNYYEIHTAVVLFENMLNVDFEYKKTEGLNTLPEVCFFLNFDRKYFKVIDLKVGYYRFNFEKIEDFFVAFYNNSYLFINLNFFISETIDFGFEYRYYFYKKNEEMEHNSIYLFLTSFF